MNSRERRYELPKMIQLAQLELGSPRCHTGPLSTWPHGPLTIFGNRNRDIGFTKICSSVPSAEYMALWNTHPPRYFSCLNQGGRYLPKGIIHQSASPASKCHFIILLRTKHNMLRAPFLLLRSQASPQTGSKIVHTQNPEGLVRF